MTKTRGPSDDPVDDPHGSLEEESAGWADDLAFEDAFIERNREALGRALMEARRDLEKGRTVTLDEALTEVREILRSYEEKP